MGCCLVDVDNGEAIGDEVINEAKVGGGQTEAVEFEEESGVPDFIEGLFEVKKKEAGRKRLIVVVGDGGEEAKKLIVHTVVGTESCLK